MANNILRHGGGIQLTAMTLPSSPVTGMIVLDIADGLLKRYDGAQWQEVLDSAGLAAELTADNISYDNTGDFNTAGATDVEAAIKAHDAALGDLPASAPVNYVPVDNEVVADHLAAIDIALGAIDVNPQFSDAEFRILNDTDPSKELAFDASAITPATTRTIIMPDADVNLGALTTANVAADGLNGSDIRLNNDQALRGRNAANSADVDLIKLSTSNRVEVGAVGGITQFNGTTIFLSTGTTALAPLTAGGVALGSGFSSRFGNASLGNVTAFGASGGIFTIASGTNDLGYFNYTTNINPLGNATGLGLFTGDLATNPGISIYSRSDVNNNANATGSLSLLTGNKSVGTANSGAITIQSGTSSLANTGAVLVASGNAAVGNSGNITLQVGTAAGVRGKIKMVDGSEGTTGYVWTSTAADGSGAWMPSAAAVEFEDDVFRINNASDPTKQIAFDANGITGGNTRTITMPDTDVNLGDIATLQSDYGLLDSRVSAVEIQADNLETLTGVGGATTLGIFSGAIIPDNQSIKSAIQSLETYIEALPDPITYAGTWDASTNTPTLADGDLTTGYLYRVNVAGTQDLGSGPIDFEVGDSVVNNGTVWEKWDHSDQVLSVNGQTGAVVLELDDLDDVNASAPNTGDVLSFDGAEWVASAPAATYTDEQAQDAVGTILTSNGEIALTYNDGTPSISAALVNGGITLARMAPASVDGNKIVQDVVLRESVYRANGIPGINTSVKETYNHSIALASLQTDTTITALNTAVANYDAVEVTYKIKQTSTNAVRLGTLRVVCDGTTANITDTFADTADLGISFTAVLNGPTLEIRYSSGANGGTMRADVKSFLV